MHPAGLFWPLCLEEVHHKSMAVPVVPLPLMVGGDNVFACLLILAYSLHVYGGLSRFFIVVVVGWWSHAPPLVQTLSDCSV